MSTPFPKKKASHRSFCSRCRFTTIRRNFTISATAGFGKVEVYVVCAKLSAGSGFGTVCEHFFTDVAARWRSCWGCQNARRVGQWQAAVAAAPPDLLPNEFINPTPFSRSSRVGDVEAQQFSFIDPNRDLDLILALSNTGSFRRLRLVCSSSSPCTCTPRYRECNRKCNTLQ